MVDLAKAATLDDAISKRFFSGDDLPAAASIESKLTNEQWLVAQCAKFGVPRELRPVCAGALGCKACDTPTGQSWNAICVYYDALEAGLRFPMPVFYQKLLRHYGLAPSQLAPNAWRYMAAFVQRCKDAGLEEPLVSAFTYFFSLCAHKDKHKDNPLGWYHFHHCNARRRCLFSGSVATKHGWKTRFFFLQPPEGMVWAWRCPLAWSKPKREAVGVVERTNAAVKELEKMPCIDLMDLLRRHGPPVSALDLRQPQLHSPTTPVVKPEPARASSAQALALTSAAADASGEGADSTRRKRKCPAPGAGSDPAAPSVTPSATTPLQLQQREWFDGASGSSEISQPPGIWTDDDALYVYDAMVRMQDEQRESQSQIAELKYKLQKCEAFVDLLVKERNENKEKHAAEVAELNQAHDDEVAFLKEKHAEEVAHVKLVAEAAAVDVVHGVKKDIVLALFPDLDASLL